VRLRALVLSAIWASQAGCADEHVAQPHASSDAASAAAQAIDAQAGSSRDDSPDRGRPDETAPVGRERDGAAGDRDARTLDATVIDAGEQRAPLADAQALDAAPPVAEAGSTDAQATDAERADAAPAVPLCDGCQYEGCMVSSALFRLAVFAIDSRGEHCYRFTYSYLGRPLPDPPYPDVRVTDGWVVEPAIFAATRADCRGMAANWNSGGIAVGGPYTTQMRGYIEIERNQPNTDPLVKQASAELTLEFESDGDLHATRLRFEDLQVGTWRDCQ
jgi:hypothetical protein